MTTIDLTSSVTPGTPGTPAASAGPAVHRAVRRLAHAAVAKGVLSLAFGAALLAWPAPTVSAVLFLFGTYAIVDGTIAVGTALTDSSAGDRGWSALQGLVGIGAGVVAVAWPGITALALLYVIGTWAIAKGLVEVGVAWRLRAAGEPRVLVGLGGLVAVAFGVSIFAHPGAGALALVALIGALALVTGVVFLTAGIRLGRREAS
jgi:uncharacterized membrane protein HdeD (DUF308 family)